ncbi:hypothetical protein HanRHA438_Chr05g0219581 [Helianthus annuus]|nr:hypothetical protein HanRHA438_Chr05g0219581 [Helianthus annuus]
MESRVFTETNRLQTLLMVYLGCLSCIVHAQDITRVLQCFQINIISTNKILRMLL